MYVVESKEPPVGESSPAYHFVGEPSEVDAYKQNMGSLVLSAVETDGLDVESAYKLVRELVGRNRISESNQDDFEAIAFDYNTLRNERMRSLIIGASRAAMSTSQLWEEYAALDNFVASDTDDVIWLNRDGLGLIVGDSDTTENPAIKVQLIDGLDEMRSEWGPDSEEFKQAEALGLNAAAYQYVLVYGGVLGRDPNVLSRRVHMTLGNKDADGNFTPVVTVLNERHPAVASSEQ